MTMLETIAIVGLLGLPVAALVAIAIDERRVPSAEDAWLIYIGLTALLAPAWLGLFLAGPWGLALGIVASALLVRAMLRTRSARGGRVRRR
jgi:hypothetical protein